MAEEPKPFKVSANALATETDSDILLINGAIYRPLDNEIIELCRHRRRRPNVVLVLVTEGGDADAAYRIARCLQSCYRKFSLLVTGYCKSAGTLVALGAHDLAFLDTGELGPLDVQLTKPDELVQTQSGLTSTSALETLNDQAFSAFETFLLKTVGRGGASISTRTATQTAVQLTCGLFSPIYGHVDPMHVGEAGRALRVATKYGQLLQPASRNFEAEVPESMTSRYPSHGFVIDLAEARKLFRQVREASPGEVSLAESLQELALEPRSFPDQPVFSFLNDEANPTPTASQDMDEASHDQPTGNATTTGDADISVSQDNPASREGEPGGDCSACEREPEEAAGEHPTAGVGEIMLQTR